jgi:predicted component of type VI protein secretion system
LPECFQNVAEFHAEAWIDHAGIWIRDYGTASGTWVNAWRLPENGEERIEPGDQVVIGDATLEAVWEAPDLPTRARERDADVDTVTQRLEEAICAASAAGMRSNPASEAARLRLLTDSELDMVMFVRRGLASEYQLLEYFDMDLKELRTHLQSTFAKLEVTSMEELVAFLLRISRDD